MGYYKLGGGLFNDSGGPLLDYYIQQVSELVLASGFRSLSLPSDVASALAKIIVALVL
jgi:hypothetical protein